MKTKVLAALVATMAVGATCAFAANPFVDVPSDSWAYKSVVELADAGIIQGVDGEHFQGQRNITRYEAAEMVAKAMAHMDKASVEQRALINKLADEFADELNNLGVRVSALENRVGNVKLTGDARVRYIYQKNSVDNDKSWDYRVRLRANAQVNDRTKVTYGIESNHSFASNGPANENDSTYTDRANVEYQLGKDWTVTAGRYNYQMGGDNAYGFFYGDVFDGAQLQYKGDSFALTGGYGKFKKSEVAGEVDESSKVLDGVDGVKTAYGVVEGFFGNGSSIGGYYNNFMAGGVHRDNESGTAFNFDDAWGAYASINLGSNWNALANYEKYSSKTGNDDPEVWVGKLTYGAANFATPKSWDIWVEYLNADDGFANASGDFLGSTNSWRNDDLMNNVKSWGAGIDYTFAKNAQFQVMQTFASEAKVGNTDPEEETRAQFVFVF